MAHVVCIPSAFRSFKQAQNALPIERNRIVHDQTYLIYRQE